MEPKRLKKEDRIEKILEAAIEIFARDGFKQASTKEIAKLAGCTEGLIFKYFLTKESILENVLSRVIEQNDPEFMSVFNQKYNLKIFLTKLLKLHTENYIAKEKINLYKVLIRQEYCDLKFALSVDKEKIQKRINPIVSELEKRKKGGEIKLSVDCESVALIIYDLLNSVKLKFLFLDKDPKEIYKQYAKLFDFLFDEIEMR